jgi:DNA polymerase-1
MILFLLNEKSYAVKKGNKDKNLQVLEVLIEEFQIENYAVKYFEDDDISEIEAKVIVTMGAEITEKILGREIKIKKARLNYYHSEEYDAYILPTFAPGFIFQETDSFIDMQQDFERLKTIDEKFPLEPEMHVFEDPDYCAKCLRTLNRKYPLLACDIETSGLDWQNNWITELGISHEENKSLIIPHELLETEKVQRELQILFSNQKTEFLWQNGKFDSKFLKYIYGLPVRQDRDTILQHYTLDERQGTHDFTRLSQLYLNAENYEEEFKKSIPKGGSYADAPDDKRRKYLAKDTAYLLLLNKLFDRKMSETDKYLYETVLLPASNFLTDIEMNGIKLDEQHLEKLDKRMKKQIKEMKADLRDYVRSIGWEPDGYIERSGSKTKPEKFNPNSYPQVFDVVFDLLELPKHNNRRSADVDARKYWLNKVCAEGSPQYKFVKKLSDFKGVKKLHSTNVAGFKKHIKEDGRVYTDFRLYGTVTGRLSSKSPNIQNIPRNKDIKNLFTAEEGNLLMEIDYSQAELRTIAYLSGDENMKAIYQKGSDLHDEVAKEFFGPDFTSEQRTFVKGINFGIPYGISAYSLAEDLDIPEKEAQKYIDKWFAEKPKVKKFIDEYKAKPAKGEPLETPFGRKRRFGAITSKNKWLVQREAINFPVQSVASDLTLLSAVRLNPKLDGLARIVNLVHDSIVMEVPEENVEKVGRIAKKVMEETPGLYLDNLDIPFTADVEVGKSWGKLKELDL